MDKIIISLITGMLPCLMACAAEKAWFDAQIGTYTTWPTNDAAFGGAWSNASAATLADGKLAFTANAGQPLAFVATANRAVGTDAKTVRVVSKIDFTPHDADNLPEIPVTAKAGVVVVKGEENRFYVVLSDGQRNVWTATTIAADAADSEVAITVATNSAAALSVTYEFGAGSVSGAVLVADAKINGARFGGSGKLAALSATYDSCTLPVNPGTNSVEVSAATEQEALAQVEIVVPDEAKGVVTDTAAYTAMFTKTATKVGEGKWRVAVVFDPANATVQEIQETVDATTRELDLAKAAGGTAGEVTVATVPGLFYVMEADGALKSLAPNNEKLGDGKAATLVVPSYKDAGFYRIKVSPTKTLP